jgi:hypothetical protein
MQVEETDVRHGARITTDRLERALEAFRALQACRGEHAECSAPVFTVKLEAIHDHERTMDERGFRLRVSTGAFPSNSREEWAMVLDVAKVHGMGVRLDNGAMVLA